MKFLILILAVTISINLVAKENILFDMNSYLISAGKSKITLASKSGEYSDIDFIYKNSNLIDPKALGESRKMKLYASDKSIDFTIADKLLYENLYNNVDLTIYKKGNTCKYDFIVYPDGNPSDIKVEISENIRIEDGILKYGDIEEYKPVTYQIIDGKKVNVKSQFQIKDGVLSFDVGVYDKDFPLVIDPEINFGSLLGGNTNDYGGHLEKDSEGNIYHAFQTETGFLLGSDKKNSKNNSSRAICIMKYNPFMELLWGMYIGAGGTNHVMDIKCDSEDNIWIGGETNSSNYPTTKGAQSYVSGYFDGVLTKISPDGDLLYSTIFGGNAYDVVAEIDIDSKNNVWATGRSTGGFGVSAGAQPYSGGYDGFIVGVSESGKFLHSSFIGTYDSDIAEGIAIDSKDNIYISGHTHSTSYFEVGKNAKRYYGQKDAFLLRYNTDTGIEWATYYGGESNDWGSNLEIDDDDNIYMSGYTGSVSLPNKIFTVQHGNAGRLDMYLAKFDTEGNNIWSTFYGGSSDEGHETTNDMYGGLDIFTNGDVLVGGRTKSSDVKIFGDGFDEKKGMQDGLLLVVDTDGNPKWSSFVGGSGYEENIDVLFDSFGSVICSGNTGSSNFPVTNNTAYNEYHNNTDAYILRFGELPDPCHQSAFELWSNPPSDFILNSEAVLLNDTLIMHSAYGLKKGSAWYHKRVPVSVGFTTEFKFVINYENVHHLIGDVEYGEGGLAFVIQNNSTSVIGLEGHGLGYDGIPNGIAIEFDTYKDHSQTENDMGDPSNGHISVMGMDNSLLSAHHNVQKAFANVELKDDGTVYHCKVEYDGEKQKMKIYFGELGSELQEVISLTIDLVYSLNLKDDIYSYLGFTAANGKVTQTHNIFDWSVCPDRNSPGTSVGDYADNDANVFVFPNPAENDISIHYAPEKMSYVNINLYDVAGKKVGLLYSGLDYPGEQTISMPLPDKLSKGMYVIEVDYGYTKEFVQLMVK